VVWNSPSHEQLIAFAETNLFAWPAAGDFVRVPKSLLPSLQLCVDYQGPRPPKSQAATGESILTEKGEPSAILKEALALTETETRNLVDLYDGLAGQFRDLSEANQSVTNGHPSSYSSGMPFAQTLVTEPFPVEGESAKQKFDTLLAAELGTERAQALSQQVENELQQRFSNYGQWRHFQTIFWDQKGNIAIGSGQMDSATGSFRSSSVNGTVHVSEVDPALLALVPDEVLQHALTKATEIPALSQP